MDSPVLHTVGPGRMRWWGYPITGLPGRPGRSQCPLCRAAATAEPRGVERHSPALGFWSTKLL